MCARSRQGRGGGKERGKERERERGGEGRRRGVHVSTVNDTLSDT